MRERIVRAILSVGGSVYTAIAALSLTRQYKSDEEGAKLAHRGEVEQASFSGSSFLFRGDDSYKKDESLGYKLGSNEAKEADIQTFAEHVQEKENFQSSRYVSFSLTRKGAAKFTKYNNILKARWKVLLNLQDQHVIKIYMPKDVERIMLDDPQRKVRQKALGVRQDMEKNAEVLIEGEISVEVLQWAK